MIIYGTFKNVYNETIEVEIINSSFVPDKDARIPEVVVLL